jgi:lipopolysaccharide export system permease protein
MKILDRYIGRAVISGTLVALAALVALDSFFSFLDELGDVGKGDYATADALYHILLTVPSRIHEMVPFAALIGALFGLGALAAHSELVVVRVAGVSVGRFVGSVLKAGLVIMVAAVVVGEGVAPPLEQYAQTRKAALQSQSTIFRSAHGFWVRDGLSFINIRDIFPGGRLGGINIYEFDRERRLRVASEVDGAVFQQQGWLLEGIRQSVIGEDGVETHAFQRAAWNSLLSPELLNVVVVKPENLTLAGLVRYIRYLRANGLESGFYEHAFWAKLTAPLAGLTMLVLAVPFVFGPLRSAGVGQRLMVGVLLGIGFHLLNRSFDHLGQIYDLNPLFSASFPSLAFLGGALVLLRRMP